MVLTERNSPGLSKKGGNMRKVIAIMIALTFILSCADLYAAKETRGASATAMEKASDEAVFHRIGDWFATRGKTEQEKKAILAERKAKRAAKKAEKMAKQKVRIKLKSYDHKMLDQSAANIVESAESTGAAVVGPIPLPTHIKKFCVTRSPFVNKDSREEFEIRTHKRLIDIMEPTPKTVDALTQLNLPGGVSIEIKI